jgi:nitrite reductase/ring-hydroxylating ferredoxin subunit
MQSFDTKPDNLGSATQTDQLICVAPVEDIPVGSSVRIALPNGAEVAVFNVNGEFYATSNFCPHKGAPLTDGTLCGYTVECEWHGWQFDVRNGECLTVPDQLESYEVRVEEGLVKVLNRS